MKNAFLKILHNSQGNTYSYNSTQSTDIPVKILKENFDICSEYISLFFNESINRGRFSDILKLADYTPDFKKGCRGSIDNHQPVNIVPVISRKI